MNTLAYYKTEISNLLASFNLKQTEELFKIVHQNNSENVRAEKKSLAGIWKDINPDHIEKEIRELRNTLQNNLDNKQL